MYWIPPPIADSYKIFQPPIAEQGTLLQTYKNVLGTRELLANTGSWRGVQPGRGTGVEPGWLWSRKFIAFISKIFRKLITGGLLREPACFGGPICSRADPLFKAKKTPAKPQKLEHTWGNTDYRVTPPRYYIYHKSANLPPGPAQAHHRVTVLSPPPHNINNNKTFWMIFPSNAFSVKR
jgi:hypothetical protein